MSYRRTYSKTFYFDQFYCTPAGIPGPHGCPTEDVLHIDPTNQRSLGFICEQAPGWIPCHGYSRLTTPLTVPTELPGTNRRLLRISANCMYDSSWGTIVDKNAHILRVFGDGGQLFESTHLKGDKNNPRYNPFNLNIDADMLTTVDVEYEGWLALIFGWKKDWVWQIILEGEYYTDVAPPQATVTITVRDSVTNNPISQALVRLMAGDYISAQAFTDGGAVTFTVDAEASYTINVARAGYELLAQSVEFPSGGAYAVDVSMVPIPSPPLPWWWWIPVVGIGGIAVVSFVLPMLRRPERPPIYVVK